MCFGLYTLFADRVGKTGTGLDGLALSVTVAALATSPVSISHAPHMSAAQWGIIAASAVLGVAIPYTMDTLSGRITSARVVGTLFSIANNHKTGFWNFLFYLLCRLNKHIRSFLLTDTSYHTNDKCRFRNTTAFTAYRA